MTRKSKQAGGNLPLTYYERTQKFASSEYGTVTQRLCGASQYQIGGCGLSSTPLEGSTALVSPSGYLYSSDAILEYLVTQTALLREQQTVYDRQQKRFQQQNCHGGDDSNSSMKRSSEVLLDEAQSIVKKLKTVDVQQSKQNDLKRTSYWLADSQRSAVERIVEKPPGRPLSPHSQQPLRRKDIWTVRLVHDDESPAKKLVCAVSNKALVGDVTAYWTDKKHEAGVIVLSSVFQDLCKDNKICPLTSQKIRDIRKLQKSGSSFASSGQAVLVQRYAPTIT